MFKITTYYQGRAPHFAHANADGDAITVRFLPTALAMYRYCDAQDEAGNGTTVDRATEAAS